MNLVPLNNNVVVQIDEKMDRSAGGLYLPDNSDKPRITGTVIAVGEETEHVTVGDRVMITYKDAYPTNLKDVFIFPYSGLLAKLM